MRTCSLATCEQFIDKYVNEYNGQCTTIEEGILGLGTIILHNAPGKKTIVIKEFFISAWASGHSVRMYNAIPAKYQTIINNL